VGEKARFRFEVLSRPPLPSPPSSSPSFSSTYAYNSRNRTGAGAGIDHPSFSFPFSPSSPSRAASFVITEEEKNQNPKACDAPECPEYAGWDDVRDLLQPIQRSNRGADEVPLEWEQMDNTATLSETEPKPSAVVAAHNRNSSTFTPTNHQGISPLPGSGSGSGSRRVLGCEITRVGEGGTFAPRLYSARFTILRASCFACSLPLL